MTTVASVEENVSWIGVFPNQVRTVITEEPPPADLCTSAFVFAFDASGKVVLVHVLKRGLDIPGGHIDPVTLPDGSIRRETPAEAARRETREEAGAVVSDLVQIGYRHMRVLTAERPDGYRYPWPDSYAVFFVGRLIGQGPVEMPKECGEPRLLAPAEALREETIIKHEALYRAAQAMTGLWTPH